MFIKEELNNAHSVHKMDYFSPIIKNEKFPYMWKFI